MARLDMGSFLASVDACITSISQACYSSLWNDLIISILPQVVSICCHEHTNLPCVLLTTLSFTHSAFYDLFTFCLSKCCCLPRCLLNGRDTNKNKQSIMPSLSVAKDQETKEAFTRFRSEHDSFALLFSRPLPPPCDISDWVKTNLAEYF